MSFPCFDEFKIYRIEEIHSPIVGGSTDVTASFHDLVVTAGRNLASISVNFLRTRGRGPNLFGYGTLLYIDCEHLVLVPSHQQFRRSLGSITHAL